MTDRIETELRAYYEVEAAERRRPKPGDERTAWCSSYAKQLAADGITQVLDVGCGPGIDHRHFSSEGVSCIGVDLAVGNAVVAAAAGSTVVPGSLFALPFGDHSLPAAWSMSTLQHVPDDRIDEALAELVRVLVPDAPVTIGVWGGRDEVIEPATSGTGIQLPRHFTLRSHDRIRSILRRRLVIERDEVSAPVAPSDWEYHLATARTPEI